MGPPFFQASPCGKTKRLNPLFVCSATTAQALSSQSILDLGDIFRTSAQGNTTRWRGAPLKIGRTVIILSIMLGTLILGLGSANGDFSLSVSPSLAEFVASPGGDLVQLITLSNEGSEEIQVIATVEDLFEGRDDLSAKEWFQLSPTEFQILPGEIEDVEVQMSVPEDAPGGGHYVAVVFQANTGVAAPDEGLFAGGAGVGARIDSIFLVTVKSTTLDLNGSIENVVPVARAEDVLGFKVEIQNDGNVHFYPKGSIEVKDVNGEVVGTVDLADAPPVYPGTSRTFELSGTIALPPGDYGAIADVDYGWETWQAELVEQDLEEWSGKDAESTSSFNSVPRLVVTDLRLASEEGEPPRIEFQLENVGDVEVEPAAWVRIVNEKGEEAFFADISQGGIPVAPHSVFTGVVESSSGLAKGNYIIETALNYHGEAPLTEASPVTVKQDIAPPQAPARPTTVPLEFIPTGDGVSSLVWVLAGVGAAAAVAGGVGVFAWSRRHDPFHLLL